MPSIRSLAFKYYTYIILMLVAICFIYYIYRARDLYKTRIYIINTALKINQPIFTTTIVYYMISY